MSERNLPFRPTNFLQKSDARICEEVGRDLAIWDDLSPEQKQFVSAHIETCPSCTAEQRVLRQATHLIASLEASRPSSSVDRTVMAAIVARDNGSNTFHVFSIRGEKRRMSPLQFAGLFVAALVVLVATFTTIRVVKMQSTQQAFLLPTTLSWSAFILYHTQTKMDAKGKRYQVASYHSLQNGFLNVETVQEGIFDVVLIDDGHDTLGMDEMHHIAQQHVQGWGLDMTQESMFDLNELRHEMNTHAASYLDKDTFRGISVYRIRYQNGLVMLLDMQYHPVNVLAGAVGPGTGEPIYNRVSLLSPSQVPSSMWNMQVPSGFKMGTLPPQPV
jgi:hypothetical protein